MIKSRFFAALLGAIALSACVSGGAARTEIARHDLPVVAEPAPVLQLRSIDVVGSSWLLTPAMHYRMASSTQRMQFAQNRWIAPPAEMVALRLKRGLSAPLPSNGMQCNLRLEVDDLVQVFADSQHSELILEARAALFSPQGILARQTFKLSVPAGADASSAAAVSGNLVQSLAQALRVWSAAACK